MFVARELYGNDDWDFTSDQPVAKSKPSPKQCNFRDTSTLFSRRKDFSRGDEARHVCSDNECFRGMVIALPLSLLAWLGVIAFLYLLFHHFQ